MKIHYQNSNSVSAYYKVYIYKYETVQICFTPKFYFYQFKFVINQDALGLGPSLVTPKTQYHITNLKTKTNCTVTVPKLDGRQEQKHMQS
jgi:hypothetical protein